MTGKQETYTAWQQNCKTATTQDKTKLIMQLRRLIEYVHPLYPQKLTLTSPTSGGRSVGIVLSRTKATELLLYIHSSCLKIQRSGFDSRHYQIFWEVVGLERGPLSLVSKIEELLGRKSSGSGLSNREYGHRGSSALTTRHPSIRKSWQ
jgi:hypothetical protein